jgi:hypothetical protein
LSCGDGRYLLAGFEEGDAQHDRDQYQQKPDKNQTRLVHSSAHGRDDMSKCVQFEATGKSGAACKPATIPAPLQQFMPETVSDFCNAKENGRAYAGRVSDGKLVLIGRLAVRNGCRGKVENVIVGGIGQRQRRLFLPPAICHGIDDQGPRGSNKRFPAFGDPGRLVNCKTWGLDLLHDGRLPLLPFFRKSLIKR